MASNEFVVHMYRKHEQSAALLPGVDTGPLDWSEALCAQNSSNALLKHRGDLLQTVILKDFRKCKILSAGILLPSSRRH